MSTPKTVLMADDCSLLRGLFRDAFAANEEVALLFASDGEEATRLARQHRPDAIVLDLFMPRMDGLSALVLLKSDAVTRDIPVLMVSGTPGDEGERLAVAFGAKGYLSKPFGIQQLVDSVHALLGLAVVEAA
jgi:CheY-like chemotaxis protein